MGGPVGPSYTLGTVGTITSGDKVWIVIEPGMSSTWPTPLNGAWTLKIYIQSTQPTSASTPVLTEAISGGANINSIGAFARVGPGILDNFKVEVVPVSQVNAGSFVGKVPTGINPFTPNDYGAQPEAYYENPTGVRAGTVYLGTDSVASTKEDS